MSFLATNIYESVLRSEYASRYTTGSDADEVKAAAHRDIDRWWHILDEALHPGPLLFGDALNVADVYLTMLACWHHDGNALHNACPNVKRAVATVLSRLAIKKVFEENGLV